VGLTAILMGPPFFFYSIVNMEEYLCFLQNNYEVSVRWMITNNERRLIIDLARFRDHLPNKNKALFQQFR